MPISIAWGATCVGLEVQILVRSPRKRLWGKELSSTSHVHLELVDSPGIS